MCVVMYKPEGITMPEQWEKYVENMELENPHGNGIMYQHKGKSYWMKSIRLDIAKSIKAIMAEHGSELKDVALAIHCRISTHGKIDTQNCHPFTQSQDWNVLGRAEGETEAGILMHNGIFSGYPSAGNHSDTMTFCHDVFAHLTGDDFKRPEIYRLLDATFSGSKVLIFMPEDVYAFGKWIERDGCFFSNDGFETRKSFYCGYGMNGWKSDRLFVDDEDYGTPAEKADVNAMLDDAMTQQELDELNSDDPATVQEYLKDVDERLKNNQQEERERSQHGKKHYRWWK